MEVKYNKEMERIKKEKDINTMIEKPDIVHVEPKKEDVPPYQSFLKG